MYNPNKYHSCKGKITNPYKNNTDDRPDSKIKQAYRDRWRFLLLGTVTTTLRVQGPRFRFLRSKIKTYSIFVKA